VPEFSAAMTKLEKGKYTETPVKTQFGYHVIRLDDVRATQIPPLEQVKPQLTQMVTEKKLREFQEALTKKAKVE
jgi:peptidyl-prolyl cis-trans isomerase C